MPDSAFDLLDAIEDYVARAVTPLRARIAELDAQIAARPAPEKGTDGVDGKDAQVDYDRIGAMLKAMVATVPAGKDGSDGAPGAKGLDGAPGVAAVVDYAAIAAMVSKAVAALPPAKDGRDGIDGRDGDPGPLGEKGLDGRDGRDAIDGLVGIKADLENERELVVSFIRSNGVRTTLREALPIPIFRGVYQDGHKYARGDNVTKNGCQWTCMADTGAAPPSADWVQSTKAGRDAR